MILIKIYIKRNLWFLFRLFRLFHYSVTSLSTLFVSCSVVQNAIPNKKTPKEDYVTTTFSAKAIIFAELFLKLKWSRICYFFYLWISIYAVFAVSMGFYANLILHNYRVLYVMKTTVKYIVILTSTGLLGHAILQVSMFILLPTISIWRNI